jgi:hypothetical protein
MKCVKNMLIDGFEALLAALLYAGFLLVLLLDPENGGNGMLL